MRYARALGISLAVTLLWNPSPAAASPRTRLLEDFFQRATVILVKATDAEQARDDVRDLAQPLLDGRRAAGNALGPAWDMRSGAERASFVRAFTDLLARAYLQMVQTRLPRDRVPSIRIVGDDVTGERDATVRTKVEARDGSDVRIDYLMTREDDVWLVHDVVIDGVSLVENYRAQFTRVLRKASFAELMARLWAMVGPGESTAALPSTGSPADAVVVYFHPGDAELSPTPPRPLERAAVWLVTHREARVRVEGHSDQQGDHGLNQALAEQRANAVRKYLLGRGVDADRIDVVAYGDGRPVCRQPLPSCWEQNRRAVIRLTP